MCMQWRSFAINSVTMVLTTLHTTMTRTNKPHSLTCTRNTLPPLPSSNNWQGGMHYVGYASMASCIQEMQRCPVLIPAALKMFAQTHARYLPRTRRQTHARTLTRGVLLCLMLYYDRPPRCPTLAGSGSSPVSRSRLPQVCATPATSASHPPHPSLLLALWAANVSVVWMLA